MISLITKEDGFLPVLVIIIIIALTLGGGTVLYRQKTIKFTTIAKKMKHQKILHGLRRTPLIRTSMEYVGLIGFLPKTELKY